MSKPQQLHVIPFENGLGYLGLYQAVGSFVEPETRSFTPLQVGTLEGNIAE